MFRRRRSTDDFAEEIQSHLALEADELQSEDLSKDEARCRDKVGFGNVQRAQERFYLRGRITWFDYLLAILNSLFVSESLQISSCAGIVPQVLLRECSHQSAPQYGRQESLSALCA